MDDDQTIHSNTPGFLEHDYGMLSGDFRVEDLTVTLRRWLRSISAFRSLQMTEGERITAGHEVLDRSIEQRLVTPVFRDLSLEPPKGKLLSWFCTSTLEKLQHDGRIWDQLIGYVTATNRGP